METVIPEKHQYSRGFTTEKQLSTAIKIQHTKHSTKPIFCISTTYDSLNRQSLNYDLYRERD